MGGRPGIEVRLMAVAARLLIPIAARPSEARVQVRRRSASTWEA
jgi:hypothetical protein